MNDWKRLERHAWLDAGPFLKVERHVLELPGGRTIEDWPWVITPDFVNVVAVNNQGHILCFEQSKYAAPAPGLAPVGGYIDPGEDPLAAAQRELLEETGHTAREWIPLGQFAVDANRGCGTAHFYLAFGAEPSDLEATSDDLEEQVLVTRRPEEIRVALKNGDVRILPWAAIFSMALGYL